MSSTREKLRMLALSLYLEFHATVFTELKMSGKITAQHEKDYIDFCAVVLELYKKYGFGFYRKVDEAVPYNTWLPLFRKNTHIIRLEELDKRQPI